MVFPSICYETFGLTIIEAFSNYCPVIAAHIGAPKYLIENNKNGFHFEAGNAMDLKAKLSEWMKLSDSKKEEFRHQAFRSYQTLYAPEQQRQYFDDIYTSVLKLE